MSQEKRKRRMELKEYLKSNNWKLHEFGDTHKPTCSRSWEDPKQDKTKRNPCQRQRKKLERNDALPLGENASNDNRFLVWNSGSQKKMAQHFSSTEWKKIQSWILCLRTLPLRNEKKIKYILGIKKTRRICC